MAHVHGAAVGAAKTGNHAAHAAHHAAHASHHAAHAAHASHGAHAAHAASHAAHAAHHAAHAAQNSHALKTAAGAMVVAKGASAAVAKKKASQSFLGRVISHPVVLFGLGVAVGYAIHKYRKEIIHSANRMAERGQDFVLQQRENLEDLVGHEPTSDV